MKKLLLLLWFACCTASADTVAIINSALKVGQISRDDARALYLMRERRWGDGQLVILFQLPPNARGHRAFVREVLEMSNEQYIREWDRLSNAGLSTFIRTVNSQKEMLLKVSSTPNALGYIDSDQLIINTGNHDVKTLRIVD